MRMGPGSCTALKETEPDDIQRIAEDFTNTELGPPHFSVPEDIGDLGHPYASVVHEYVEEQLVSFCPEPCLLEHRAPDGEKACERIRDRDAQDKAGQHVSALGNDFPVEGPVGHYAAFDEPAAHHQVTVAEAGRKQRDCFRGMGKVGIHDHDAVPARSRDPGHNRAGQPAFPLALELDERPREQTLFFLGDDGILTGETWPQSRNVLRVSYEISPANPERVRVAVVPEVRQRLDGWRWVRSGAGLAQVPQYSGRAFGAAGFTVDLEPGEFLLVAPGPQADLYGMVGGAFLSSEREGERCDSYVFLRADMNHVAFRN